MTLVFLFWSWALIVAVCTAGSAIARLVGQRLDDAEVARSRRQWRLMCEALEIEDFADDVAEESFERSATSPA